MAVWSSSYVSSLPNSSFAWIDGSGGRHLPYKDKSGKVDAAHTRNALARLNQVKGLSGSKAASVRRKLEAALKRVNKEASHSFLNVLDFADAEVSTEGYTWVDAFKQGEWHDARYGVTNINQDYLESIVKNFNDNVRGIEIAVDYDHGKDSTKGHQAAGWIRSLRRIDDKIQAAIEFTEEALAEVKAKKWRYFSPRFVDEYVHSEGGEVYGPTLLLGSITNTPVFKGMAPINFSEAILDEELTLIPEVEEAPVTSAESREQEHGEPGTGPAPRPFESEPVHFTPKHPLENDPDVAPGTEKDTEALVKEGVVDEAKLREMLGIAEDADIGEALVKLVTDAKAFSDLRAKAEQTKTFAEQYPDQYKEHVELKERVLKQEAKDFADSFTKSLELEGGGKSHVVPPIVRDKIETIYTEFAEGKGTVKSFTEVMDSIRTAGLVKLGESGSSLESENDDRTDADKVKSFAEEMGKLMTGEDKLDPVAAMNKAAEDHPDLYKAYIDRELPQGAPSDV